MFYGIFNLLQCVAWLPDMICHEFDDCGDVVLLILDENFTENYLDITNKVFANVEIQYDCSY